MILFSHSLEACTNRLSDKKNTKNLKLLSCPFRVSRYIIFFTARCFKQAQTHAHLSLYSKLSFDLRMISVLDLDNIPNARLYLK